MRPSRADRNRFRPTVASQLEDRLAPAVFNIAAGDVAGLVAALNTANGNAQDDTINIAGGRFVFQTPADSFDGGTALPVVESDGVNQTVTINGNGATFFRPDGAPSFRFLRAQGKTLQPSDAKSVAPLGIPTLNVNGITFEGGNVYDYGTTDRNNPGALAQLVGGAVMGDNANFAFDNCVFLNNTATESGGAFRTRTAAETSTTAAFTNSNFQGNIAGTLGGAAYGTQEGGIIRSNIVFGAGTTVQSNTSLTGAGAAQGETYTVNVVDAKVLNNTGTVGGIDSSLVDLERSLVQGNTGSSGPGGVIARSQILRIKNSTIAFNTSKAGGTAVGQAGGLAVEVINSTITNNTGADAALVATQGEVVLAFATITDNVATTGNSGGVAAPRNIITISRSVVTGGRSANTASTVSNLQAAIFRNLGFNFIGIAPANYPIDPTDQVGRVGNELNPLLGPLDNYGGPTPTRSPAAGSPLINRGGIPEATRLGTDQRGQPRNVGGSSDIGAFEVQPTDVLPAASPLLPVDAGIPDTPGTLPTGPDSTIAVGPGGFGVTAGNDPTLPVRLGQAGPGGTLANTPPSDVTLRNADGSTRITLAPFGVVPGGIRTATADFNGDGQGDLVATTGSGVAVQVKVLDGVTGQELFNFVPFGNFTGGAYVAVGDVTGDGQADIAITPDEGGGPRVIVLTGVGFGVVADFFGIQDPSFTGGARAAIGDMNGDGFGELIVAAGFGGGPRVTIWDGVAVAGAGGFTPAGNPLSNFFAFEDTLRNGCFVAAGDVNGDGFADLILGGGPGGGPRVRIADGLALLNATNFVSLDQRLDLQIGNFFAGDPNTRGGVRVAAKNLDGDGLADVVAGDGIGVGSTVRGYSGATISGNATPTTILSFEAYPGFAGGVFVG